MSDEVVEVNADCQLVVSGVKTLRTLQRELRQIEHTQPLSILLAHMLSTLDRNLDPDRYELPGDEESMLDWVLTVAREEAKDDENLKEGVECLARRFGLE